MKRKIVLFFIIFAVFLKISLYAYTLHFAPNAKFKFDTSIYLETTKTLMVHGVFGTVKEDGNFSYQLYRTPGYPLFIGIFVYLFDFSLNGVIFVQIVLTLFTALITYKTANMIDQKLGMLSALIILFDPAITVYSLLLLTEALFLFFITLFMFIFVKFLKEEKIKYLVFSAFILGAATYIRPISYFMGGLIGLFIFYKYLMERKFKKAFGFAMIFIIIVHSLLGLWQYRNYRHFGRNTFCHIGLSTIKQIGFYKSYLRKRTELAANSETKTKLAKTRGPVHYYLKTGFRSFMSLMTRPSSLKHFGNKNLKMLGKVFSYPWIVFWLAGMIIGIAKIKRRDYCYQFLFWVIIYFICTTIGASMESAGARLRVPMVPFMAILSSFGWFSLYAKWQNRL